jgi:hypothetical protein
MLHVWQASIVDEDGTVIPNANVEVKLATSGAFAALYEDADGATPLDNPFVATTGFARFYSRTNIYRVRSYKDANERIFEDVEVGPAIYRDTPEEIANLIVVADYDYPFGHAWRYGATGDGTDQTAQLQAALYSGAMDVYIPRGTYLVGTPLDIPSGVTVHGDGAGTILQMTSTTSTPNIFKLTSRANVIIEKMKLLPMNSGAFRAAVYLVTCENVTCQDVLIESTSATACFAIDCDYCTWTRWHYVGSVTGAGYAVFLIGCKSCKISDSSAVRPEFGFTSASNEVASLAIYGSLRTAQESFGNSFVNCHVREADGHAFDLNSVTGNIIDGCSAEDYAGASTNQAFQIKHSSGDECRMNVISNCTSRNNPTGFGAQQGSYCIFSNCTAIDSSNWAFQVNDCNNFIFDNCIARNFTTFGLWVNSSSNSNTFTNFTLQTATPTAIAIGLETSGSSGNQFDGITLIGTFAKGIHIASGASNNRFGRNIRLAENTIDDESNNSLWPVLLNTPEVDLSVTGNVNGPYVHRGMIVARARFVITATISGTPQVQCGRLGSNTEIAAAQVIAGASGSTVLLTQATQRLNPAAIMQARVQVAGTGSGLFQYEGLPRL